MGWTREQRMVVAILPKISSVLSLFGSSWIAIEITTEGKKIHNPYHRLLLAMSVYDILESVWNFGSTWPIPEGSPDVIWAIGNTATCTAQGFFLTLSVAVPIYNAMLSLYYVLVINYNYTNVQLRRTVEPIMHTVAFVWAFGTALYSALTGLINNANLWCWIAPLPSDCLPSFTHGTAEEGNPRPCIRGDNQVIFRFAFYFIPLWFCIFFATVCALYVYKYVHARDRASLRYRRPMRQQAYWRKSNTPNDEKKEGKIANVPISDHDETENKVQFVDAHKEARRSSVKSIDSGGRIHSYDNIDISEEDSKMAKKSNPQSDSSLDEKAETSSPVKSKGRRSIEFNLSLDRYKEWKSKRTQFTEEMPHTVEVFHQACFYLGVFYATHIWSTSNRIVQAISNGETVFPLIAAHSFFDPLQGFLNYFVYQRPRFLRVRRQYPEIGRMEALRRILRFTCQGDNPDWNTGQRSSRLFGFERNN